MSNTVFSWKASEEDTQGHALYKLDGKTILSLQLTDFVSAHAVSTALDKALSNGYKEGLQRAKAVMQAAIQSEMP